MRWAEPNVSNSNGCHKTALDALRAGCQAVSSAHRIDCLRILARGVSHFGDILKFDMTPSNGYRHRIYGFVVPCNWRRYLAC